jgi:beta-galactosidase
VDDDSLTADGSDSTRVQLQVVDAYGAPRVSRTGDVTLALSGPATLIGDNPFPLKDTGGVGAVWVRSQPGVTGEVVVRATHDSLGSGEASITVA